MKMPLNSVVRTQRLVARVSCQLRNRQRGISMIEVLITLLITTFALLVMATFVTKATALTADAAQRARALALLNDMSGRIASSKARADDFASGTVYGDSEEDCKTRSGAARDLCEWNNLLFGTHEGQKIDPSPLGFRGCVTRPSVSEPVYVVTVAWASLAPGVPPTDACGAGAFGDDSQRRTIRLQVRVATLTA
jgi:type IV pilus assembly protein PilV